MTGTDLRNHLDGYLELRRTLGFEMIIEGRLLADFVTFFEVHQGSDPHTAQAALDWACSRGGARWQARRLSIVRGFLFHLRVHSPDIEVPAAGLIPTGVRPTPYIYTEEEIVALMNAARLLKPHGSLRPHTYATLIGLLASCGLRPGEAVRLRDDDVELDSRPPRLVIRETKFRKSRLVPIDPSIAEALCSYAAARKRLGYDGLCETFFVSESGATLAYSTVGRTFRRLLRQVGIDGTAHQSGPNLRCLRHSFAVRRMLDWYTQGVDVNKELPNLSVYLGHLKPVHTYWYLTATPGLLTKAAARFESYVSLEGAP